METFKLGIDVGGTKIAYAILSTDNQILYRHQEPNDLEITCEEFTKKLFREIEITLEQSGYSVTRLLGIAIGMPSYVDYDNGIVITSGSIYKIKNYPIRDILKKEYPEIPIVVDGDTNMAALAEHKYGIGKSSKHMVYVALSTGLGTGFIVNNHLFRGSYGGAGESGHMIITPDKGLTDGCGNQGCFMSYACGSYLVKHAIKEIGKGVKTSITDLVVDLADLRAQDIVTAYQQGDKLASDLLEQLIYYASLHIYNLFIAFNINYYVCGGGLTNMGEFFLTRIQEQVDKFNQQENQKIYIKKAALGNDNGIIGCGVALDKEEEVH